MANPSVATGWRSDNLCFSSSYQATPEMVRRAVTKLVECFVKVPLEEVIKPDVTGLYKRVLAGKISNFTRNSDPYVPPADLEIAENSVIRSEAANLQVITEALHKASLL